MMCSCVAALLLSCKGKESQNVPNGTHQVVENTEKKASKNTFQVNESKTEVFWTGYKFTKKTAVSGKFKTLKIKNAPVAHTPLQAFNGLSFEIPVSSIFSGHEGRDHRLVQLFFKVMDNTEVISGNFEVENNALFLNLTLNNVSKRIAVTSKVANRHVNIEGKININDFKAKAAFDSIHKACELLHTGDDGVSKTWEEFAIGAMVYLQ